MDFYTLSTSELTLLCLAALSFFFQLWFLLVRIRPMAFYKGPTSNSADLPPISVIICAKNEAENLKKYLPPIFAQNYPDFQVIVVNDCSEDDSEMVLAQLKREYPQLYYTTIPVDRKFSHGKKLALTVGVKAAKNDHLLLIDADCYPAGDNWIREMVKGFSQNEKEIVIGFGGYEKQKGFINLLVRYDTFFIAMQYAGFALSGKPYMAVGRNLAYKKSLFVGNNGVKKHSHILSGDDDLFVQETATPNNTSVVINPEAHTVSAPPFTFRQWLEQKSRHLTTTTFYKHAIKTELFLEPFSRLLFWSTSLFLIFFNIFALYLIGAIIVKIALQLVLWKYAADRLNQGKVYLAVVWFEWLHPILLLRAYSNTVFRRNNRKWK
jgi:poly-beta-1,6-N-acetyl-D-glucosamine synthase